MGEFKSVNFEVFGIVQGVFFRKHTKMEADKLGLKGFVQNTKDGTVIGALQGKSTDVDKMKNWLQTKGSPSSRIDKVNFSDEKTISNLSYEKFLITLSKTKTKRRV